MEGRPREDHPPSRVARSGARQTHDPNKSLRLHKGVVTSPLTKKDGRTKRVYEKTPKTPYQRLLDSPDIPEATKAKLRAEHATLDPFALKKIIELKLKKFFTALGNLNREATKL